MSRREWAKASLLGVAMAGGWPTEAQAAKRIIDTHIHLWKLPRSAPPMNDFASYPPAGSPWLNRDRLIADYNARVGGPEVSNVVLIESSVAVPPDKIMQSNRWMLDTAAAESKILSVIGNLDIRQAPEAFAEQATQLSANRQWVGIRIGGAIFQSRAAASVSNIFPNVMTNLAFLAKKGLHIDTLGIGGAVLAEIGAAVPGLVIVMDHFAGKPNTFEVEDTWKADMAAAAKYTNLHVKVSDVHKQSQAAAGQAGGGQYQPVADPARYAPTLEFLWNTLGEDRLLFGTNWPVSDAAGLFVDSIDLQIRILESFLTGRYARGRDKVMFRNALRVYSPRK